MEHYYDAICILSWLGLLILSVLVYENARIPVKDKRVFYLTYLLIAVSQFAEWAGIQLNSQDDSLMPLLTIAKCADYIFTPMVGGALVLQMRIWNKWSKAIIGLVAINTIFQIVSAFNGWVFFINNNNCYEVGHLYWLYLAISFLVVLLVTVQFVVFGRKHRRQNQVSLYLLLVLTLSAISMQEILPWESRTLYIGITLTSALLFIHVTEFSQLEADDYLSEQLVKINTDALTGLFSRHAYSQALKDYNAMSTLPRDFAVVSIDVNGLKSTNDNLGHEAGDELIVGAAECIKDALGEYGRCYRTGGDEFIVLAHAGRAKIADAVRHLEEKTQGWSGDRVKELNLAVGCALAEDHKGIIAEKLVNEADIAMYAAKAAYYQISGNRRREYNYFDPLTGLPSMAYFCDLAQSEQEAILAKGNTPAILFADIAGMKAYNEKFGFIAGDDLLRSFAHLLKQHFGINHCGRFGQDHFAALVCEEGLEEVLGKLFEEWKAASGGDAVSVHVGICQYAPETVDVATAADQAKLACDSLRSTAGSTYCYYDQAMQG